MRSILRSLMLAALTLGPALASPALAQDGGAMPPGHPPGGGGGGGRGLFDAPPVATAAPSDEVPAGSIRVTVVDQEGHPIAGAQVILGTMAQGGDRESVNGTTDAEGRYTFTDLSSGESRAYRIRVPHEGATYGSTPFRLPPERGYDVRVTRLPVTRDDRTLLQLIGQTYVEVRDDRLHIIQQSQLAYMSESPVTYVFPDEGLRVRLPEGFLAFQSQPVMTDQRVEALDGHGFRIRGSLPPGQVTLTWAFDLPITGADMDVRLEVPMRTYLYRLITDRPPGMRLRLEGLPAPQEVENQGQMVYVSELVRRPGDPPFESVTIGLRGLPRPGPARWIAVIAAVLLMLGGALWSSLGASASGTIAASRARRRKALLDEVAELEEELARGDIGPEYRQKRRAEIVRELAMLLHSERAAARSAKRETLGRRAADSTREGQQKASEPT